MMTTGTPIAGNTALYLTEINTGRFGRLHNGRRASAAWPAWRSASTTRRCSARRRRRNRDLASRRACPAVRACLIRRDKPGGSLACHWPLTTI